MSLMAIKTVVSEFKASKALASIANVITDS